MGAIDGLGLALSRVYSYASKAIKDVGEEEGNGAKEAEVETPVKEAAPKTSTPIFNSIISAPVYSPDVWAKAAEFQGGGANSSVAITASEKSFATTADGLVEGEGYETLGPQEPKSASIPTRVVSGGRKLGDAVGLFHSTLEKAIEAEESAEQLLDQTAKLARYLSKAGKTDLAKDLQKSADRLRTAMPGLTMAEIAVEDLSDKEVSSLLASVNQNADKFEQAHEKLTDLYASSRKTAVVIKKARKAAKKLLPKTKPGSVFADLLSKPAIDPNLQWQDKGKAEAGPYYSSNLAPEVKPDFIKFGKLATKNPLDPASAKWTKKVDAKISSGDNVEVDYASVPVEKEIAPGGLKWSDVNPSGKSISELASETKDVGLI